MALPSEKKIFFLGIEGEQKGPFTDAEIEQFIRSKELQRETLVWFEGLAEWQKIESLPNFKDWLDAADQNGGSSAELTEGNAPSTGVQFKPLEASSESGAEVVPDVKEQTPTLKAVFADQEAEELPEIKVNHKRTAKVVGITGSLVAGLIASVYFFLNPIGNEKENAPIAKARKEDDSREKAFRKAQSEFLLNPQKSIEVYQNLLKQKKADEIEKNVISELVDYYNLHDPKEAGNLLLSLNRVEEAITYFYKDPIDNRALSEGLLKAFEQSQDLAKKKKYLSDLIALYLGPLNNQQIAIEKIRLFETTFPNESHSFSYYLKDSNGRVKDIFDRISFTFVDGLMNYIRSEMPEIRLTHRPTVEIRKADGKFKIVGSYKGDLTLNRDQLSNIHFSFWKISDSWILIETNLTKERTDWAREQKRKFEKEGLSETELLNELELVFKSRYPKKGLHETLDPEKNTVN